MNISFIMQLCLAFCATDIINVTNAQPVTPDHIVTVEIRLDDRPQDISWKLKSGNGIVLNEVAVGHYADKPNQLVFEETTVQLGKKYIFSIDAANIQIKDITGRNVVVYNGILGQGQVVRRFFFSGWTRSKEFSFWIKKYQLQEQEIGESCNANWNCGSGKCQWGKCREVPPP